MSGKTYSVRLRIWRWQHLSVSRRAYSSHDQPDNGNYHEDNLRLLRSQDHRTLETLKGQADQLVDHAETLRASVTTTGQPKSSYVTEIPAYIPDLATRQRYENVQNRFNDVVKKIERIKDHATDLQYEPYKGSLSGPNHWEKEMQGWSDERKKRELAELKLHEEATRGRSNALLKRNAQFIDGLAQKYKLEGWSGNKVIADGGKDLEASEAEEIGSTAEEPIKNPFIAPEKVEAAKEMGTEPRVASVEPSAASDNPNATNAVAQTPSQGKAVERKQSSAWALDDLQRQLDESLKSRLS